MARDAKNEDAKMSTKQLTKEMTELRLDALKCQQNKYIILDFRRTTSRLHHHL